MSFFATIDPKRVLPVLAALLCALTATLALAPGSASAAHSGDASRISALPAPGLPGLSDGSALHFFPSGSVSDPPVTLTVEKTGAGAGSVFSSPAGIECGSTCSAEFEEAAEVTLTATPEAGSTFAGWSGACSGTGECKVMMTEPEEVKAEFALIPRFTLTVSKSGAGQGTVTSSPAGIECGLACSAEFEEGSEVELTATPEPGSTFVDWTGACSGTGVCRVTMSSAAEVEAVFAPLGGVFGLTVLESGSGQGVVTSSPPGIECGLICEAEFAEGSEVELTATPEAGSTFTGWSGACSGSGECKVTMSEAREVTAEFAALPSFTLKVAKAGAGTGTVTSAPAGIECGLTCEAQFAEGSEVELTATPEAGSTFAGWSGACSGTGECKVTLSETKEVTAEFAAIPKFPLTVAITGKGTVKSANPGIECPGTCAAEFEAGSVTLEEQPETGYEFAGWLGCRNTGETSCEVHVTGETEVTAVFLKAAKEGTEGPEGPEGPEGNQGPAGPKGTNGENGAQGPPGAQGEKGSAGAGGATGPAGPQGPAGVQGPGGPAGAQGPAGPAGKIELVTCTTVKQNGKSRKKCTTKLVSGPVKFTAAGSTVHATLARHGTVYATGTARSMHGRLNLRLLASRRLLPGRYTLTLVAGAGRQRIVRRESLTLH